MEKGLNRMEVEEGDVDSGFTIIVTLLGSTCNQPRGQGN